MCGVHVERNRICVRHGIEGLAAALGLIVGNQYPSREADPGEEDTEESGAGRRGSACMGSQGDPREVSSEDDDDPAGQVGITELSDSDVGDPIRSSLRAHAKSLDHLLIHKLALPKH